MFEVKITIEAPMIVEALNNIAAALSSTARIASHQVTPVVQTTTQQQSAPATQIATQQTVPVTQTTTQQTIPVTQTTGVIPTTQVVQDQSGGGVIPTNTQQTDPSAQGQIDEVTRASNIPLNQTPQYTIEQIMTAGGALVDSPQRRTELMNLLAQFGVQAVTQLKQEQLGAFAIEMRKLGAQI